jgi:hypothetical protein
MSKNSDSARSLPCVHMNGWSRSRRDFATAAVPMHTTSRTLKSRYAISIFNHSRWIRSDLDHWFYSSENRGSGLWNVQFTWQREPRNHDMRFHDLIAAVKSRMRSGPLIFFIGVSGIGISICKEHNATKTPISRYAKSRLNLHRQINMWSRPSIQLTTVVHVS